MRLPRNVSPAAAARRSLLIDALVGLALALFAIALAAGIGVVGFFALLVTLAVALWSLVEGALRLRRRRARGRGLRRDGDQPSSATSSRTRPSISSRTTRTSSSDRPAGSGSSQST